MKKSSSIYLAVLCALLLTSQLWAGTVTGQFQNPGGGGLVNGTLTFALTQPAVVSGTASVVPSSFSCFTDASGNVVGEPNPQVAPVLSVNLASGTLPAGTYYVKIAIQDASGVTVVSPEAVMVLGSSGTLNVVTPAKQPASANGYQIFISTTPGTETLQGTVTGVPGSWGNYSQSSALVAGSAAPASNTTQCKLRFNDELQPSFTCYNASLITQTGVSIPGYPQYWYLYGGTNGTISVSTGTPQSNICQGSGVIYPQAIVTSPAMNGQQSINGPLSLNGYPFSAGPITGTNLQAKGPNPWYDVCQNGFACDGTTSDTTAFNTLIAAACTAGGGTLWFPPATTVRFGSAPNHIPCGLTLQGAYSKGSAFGYGSFIKCDYTEATATNACLWWDGANAATQGNGGGIRGINIQKGDGKTGGAAVKISGTDCTARAGNIHVNGVKVSSNTGAWNYGLYVDGTTCTTAGQQGSRDNSFIDVDLYGATTKAASLNGCSHCYTFGVEASIGAGSNADIDVTGTAGNGQSNDVLIVASMFSNMSWDQSTSITCAGCNVTGTWSTTANNTTSLFSGVAAAVSNLGAASYLTHNLILAQGNITSNTQVTAGAQAANCSLAGEMCEATSSTAGSHFIGSDGQFLLRRNTGSAAGSNFTWSYDGGGTFPFAFDATNGFNTTLSIVGPSLGLKNGFTTTITPNSIAANRAISMNDPLNSAVLPTYIQVTDTVDLASVATGACTAERTVTATGARFGDSVTGGAGTAIEAGGFIVTKVSAADAIKWQLCNLSGGAIDRASDTYTLRVIK